MKLIKGVYIIQGGGVKNDKASYPHGLIPVNVLLIQQVRISIKGLYRRNFK